MFAAERLNIIKSYLKEHQRLDVHSLSELLNVSEVTIRRDLERLEEAGVLTRIHGGAVPAAREPAAVAVAAPDDRNDAGRAERDAIAALACRLVRDGDVVALLNGDICQLMARRLSERSGLTVLTNDILVALEISGQPENKAIVLGGVIARDERALFGSLCLGNLRNYCVNHLFVEIDGMDDQLHVTVKSQDKADLIREALACAEQAVALSPADNFGRNAFYRLGPAASFKKIVTSPQLADEFKAKLFGTGIQLYTSAHAFERGG